MKSKTKFNPKVIEQFFIDHTEKFVVGLVAALFLFFAYQSFMLQKYPRKPEELVNVTSEALARINKGPATKKAEQAALAAARQSDKKIPNGSETKIPESETKLPLYSDKIKELFDTPIKVSDYPMPPRLNWKPIAPRRLRGAPEVFALEKLRAIPGRGAISAVKDKSGTLGKRWIIVTGLVPYKKQSAEYRDKFEGAVWNDHREDKPNYLCFFVQRAEVVPAATGEPKWSKFMVFPPGANEAAKMGAKSAAKIVDSRFVRPSLTAPLPLLKGANWGNEAVFPPQIPMVEQKADKDEGTATAEGPGPDNGHNPPPAADPPDIDAGGESLLGETVSPKPKTEQAAPKEEEVQIPDYLLLRFLDFDVKPNKQYHYRIFLVLRNPNYGLDPKFLEEQELATSQGIGVKGTKPIKNTDGKIVDWPTDSHYAKWSSSCTSDPMSSDMRLLGGPVVALGGPAVDPENFLVVPHKSSQLEINADVRVLIWQKESGLNGSFHKQGLIRGTVLNFPGAEVKALGVAKPTQVNLTPNCILVDIQGGDPAPREKEKPEEKEKKKPNVSPGMILVMDESGNLVMHDEVAESQEWDKATKDPEQPPPDIKPKTEEQGKNPDNVEGLDPGRVRPPGRRGGNP